jgi:arginase
MKNICILEFPSNLGLYEPAPGLEPAVKKLPAWLRAHGFYDLLRPAKVYSLSPPPYSMQLDQASAVRNADAIIQYAGEQASLLGKLISTTSFPVVIGGDCSILIGNALALKKTGNYGLFFLDGHTDFAWPALSQTAGAAGMDLAIATGNGHEKLTNIDGEKPYFREEQVWCVGNREYDDVYVKTIQHSRINYIDLNSLRNAGISHCISGFNHMVKEKELDGFWIHIDVDVLDDNIMPAVDSRQADGLTYTEFNEILQLILSNPKAAGLEITILDPDRDPTGQYTREFIRNFCIVLNTSELMQP